MLAEDLDICKYIIEGEFQDEMKACGVVKIIIWFSSYGTD